MKKGLAKASLLSLKKEDDCQWQVFENKQYLWLQQNSTVQSVMIKKKPSQLVFPHQQALAKFNFNLPKHANILELGLGGGGNLRYLLARYPESHYQVVELSEAVIDLFYQYFNPERLNLSIGKGDAFDFVAQSDISYDLIISDLFCRRDVALNIHKQSYVSDLKASLKDGGYLYINLLPETKFDIELVKATLLANELKIIFDEKIIGFINHVLVCEKLTTEL